MQVSSCDCPSCHVMSCHGTYTHVWAYTHMWSTFDYQYAAACLHVTSLLLLYYYCYHKFYSCLSSSCPSQRRCLPASKLFALGNITWLLHTFLAVFSDLYHCYKVLLWRALPVHVMCTCTPFIQWTAPSACDSACDTRVS